MPSVHTVAHKMSPTLNDQVVDRVDYTLEKVLSDLPAGATTAAGLKKLVATFAGGDAANEQFSWCLRLGYRICRRGGGNKRGDDLHNAGSEPVYLDRLIAEGKGTLGALTGVASRIIPSTEFFADTLSITSTTPFGSHLETATGKSITVYSNALDGAAQIDWFDFGDADYVHLMAGLAAPSGGSSGDTAYIRPILGLGV